MKKLLFVLFFLPALACPSVLVEPYLGYVIGSGSQKLAGTSCVGDPQADYSYKDAIYGGRLGVVIQQKFVVGVDYSKSEFVLESDVSGVVSSATTENKTYMDNVEKTQLGAFLGYLYSKKLSFRVSYFKVAKIEGLDGDVSTFQVMNNSDLYSGDGIGIAISYKIADKVAINAEYRSFTYDEWEDRDNDLGSASGTFGDRGQVGATNMELKEYIISVSLPIEL